jgi:hypothetical protein
MKENKMNKKIVMGLFVLGASVLDSNANLEQSSNSPRGSRQIHHAGVRNAGARGQMRPRSLTALLERAQNNDDSRPANQTNNLDAGGFNLNINNINQVTATPVGLPLTIRRVSHRTIVPTAPESVPASPEKLDR